MIITGGAAGNVGWWGKHLEREDTNERAEVMEISGLLATNLPTALREMEAIAGQSRSGGNFMYQANLNPRDDEHLTEKQWKEAIDTLENHMGLGGHQRVVVEHEKEGRTHRHVIWNRVDVETLRVTDIGGNYYTHERVARTLELKFDLQRTASLHGERRPDGRPDRTPELWEQRAAERSGIDPKQVTAELSALWRSTDSGKAFAAAIEERGYILAQGDRRNFCILDHAGDVHSLARRIDGVKAKDLNERLNHIDPATLPTVDEARATQREKYPTHEAARTEWENSAVIVTDHAPKQEQVQPQIDPNFEVIKKARKETNNAKAFIETLEEKGFVVGRVTEAEADRSHINRAFADEIGRRATEQVAGDFFAVSQEGRAYRLYRKPQAQSQDDQFWAHAASFDDMTEKQTKKAEASYAAWTKRREEAKERGQKGGGDFSFRDYVEYTQNKARNRDEKKPRHDFDGVDPGTVLNLTDARAVQKEARRANFATQKQADRDALAAEQAHAREPTKMEAKILHLQEMARHGGGSLATALYNEGITLARVDAAGKTGVQRDYERQFYEARISGKEDARQRHATFSEGELVAVTRYGDVHRLNPHRIDHQRLEQTVCGNYPAPSLSATREFYVTDRAAARNTKATEKMDDQAYWAAQKLEPSLHVKGHAKEAIHTGLRVADKATGFVTSLASFADSLLSGKPAMPRSAVEQIQANRRALIALERIRDSMERGENLRPSDVASLTPSHLENIRLRGDDAIRQMIEGLERRRERERDYGRERER